jgi:hypothetical protein
MAAVATAAYGRGAAGGVPRGFQPETAAAVGTHDLWVLGDRALLRSTDGGKHFVRVARPPLQSQGTVPTLEFANIRDGFAYVWGSGPLYVTHDGGSSWHRAGPEGHVRAFAAGGGDAYVAVGHVLERSPVGRNAWRRITAFAPRSPVSLAARASDVWFLGQPRRRPDFDTIALSSDRGRTFVARKGPCLSELGGTLVPTAGGVVWAVCPTGMMAGLVLSTDGGHSFSIRSFHDPGGIHRPALTNGARIAAASARVAVLSGGGGGPLLRTTDAGRRWSRVPRTARIREVFWLAFTTRRVGAAVIQTGPRTEQLWRTTDGGATWHSVPIR